MSSRLPCPKSSTPRLDSCRCSHHCRRANPRKMRCQKPSLPRKPPPPRRPDTALLPGSPARPAQVIFSFFAISPVKRLLDAAKSGVGKCPYPVERLALAAPQAALLSTFALESRSHRKLPCPWVVVNTKDWPKLPVPI